MPHLIANTFVIADNQAITARGIRGYIQDLFGECPTSSASEKKELFGILARTEGNVVVVIDYTLFDFNGVEDLLIAEKRFPDVDWLLFSNELSENFIRKVGAESHISIILKESSGEEIRSALSYTAAKDRFICQQIANLLMCHYGKEEARTTLTPTETEILRMVAAGMSVKEIAWQRNSSVHTITTHKKNIFRKLGVNNVYEATKYALRAGLVDMMEYYI